MENLTCAKCGAPFSLPPKTAGKYPGWKPKECLKCYGRTKSRRSGPEPNLPTADVLARFKNGPDTGVFTDGSCESNPHGRGGWGVVKVVDGNIVAEKNGCVASTTNNRMELTALIEAVKLLSPAEEIVVYTDNEYCRKIACEWAAAWKRNGWTRGKQREEVKNLDLVKELHEIVETHPGVTIKWIRGHEGSRWNEYADSLSTAYRREVV